MTAPCVKVLVSSEAEVPKCGGGFHIRLLCSNKMDVRRDRTGRKKRMGAAAVK